MNFGQLEYIVALNRHRHFQKAAAACHVTQPTLSMQVSKLEQELGVIIFDRSKSPLLPTLVGERIIAQAQKAIKEYKAIFEVVENKQGKVEGSFRLALIPTISPYLIPLFLESFTKKYPAVELTMIERTTCEIVNLLKNDEIDAGIVSTPLGNSSLIERVLYYEPFRVFVSNNHSLSKKKKIKESDLDPSDIWLISEGHCFRNQALKICSSTIIPPNKSKVQFESGSMETLKNLIKRGEGATLLPYLATTDLEKNVLSFCKPEPTREVSLIHGRSFLKEDIVVALQDHIVEVIPAPLKSLKAKNVLNVL